MSLQFIVGPSGAGKSHYLYQKATEESLKHPEKNYLVLVPDQFTMQTQKDLVLASPRNGILNVDVLSFTRLAHRIFEEMGGTKRIVLDDVGKSFVLRKIAGDYEEELHVLGGNLKKTGFIGEVKSVISEFTQYDIHGEQLNELLKEEPQSNFYYKLQDIKLVYEGFQKYLSDKYITGEELLDVLCLVVQKSKILKDSVIVLDGFTGFTPVQLKLIRELCLVTEQIIVTITMDDRGNSKALFDMSKHMMDVLTRIARETKTEIDEPVSLIRRPVYRFRDNKPLAFLEENLFRYSRRQYEGAPDEITIYQAKNPKEEVELVARKIRHLVRTKGLRYREIAVIASDMATYESHVEKLFEAYEIPIFMDAKRSILLNSFVEYLRSLLAMAEQNFTYESVFRFLRTGLCGFTQEEIDLVENYCVALGIRGYKRWNEKWIRKSHGMTEEDLEGVNQIRVRFLEKMEEVLSVLRSRSKTVKDVTYALHQFFLKEEMQQKIKNYELQFQGQGELALEKEYAQVYRIVMDLFDQFVELLGDERISLKEYCELLDAGLEEAKVGIIPPSIDQVVIGDIERTRVKDIKVILFLGLNDAYIPGKVNAGGLLSERDRERFKQHKIALAPGAKEKAFIQKYYLYLILTKPSKSLVLTYSNTKADGTSLRPSYLIQEVQKLFPKLKIQEAESSLGKRELTTKSAFPYLVECLQNRETGLDTNWQELYTWYKKSPEWQAALEQMLDASFFQKEQSKLSRETAEKLYGSLLENSVTRLERFSACAFSHFLMYGLRLKERETYQFQAMDLGNLFHGAMERFSKKMREEGLNWVALHKQDADRLIESSVEETIVDYENTILYSSARNEYVIKRLTRLMHRSVWALTKQLEHGDFLPKGYEVVYDSGAIPLEDYHHMRLHGKIDRVDICETEEDVFIKVIDYKTGMKAFDLGELYHGLQMQLVIYMNAAMEQEQKEHPEKRVVPAGLFYYRMKDPIVDDASDDTVLEETLLKELMPDGVVQQSEEVLQHLHRGLEGKSTVIPVARNKDGSLSKTSKVLSEEEFQCMMQYAKDKTIQIGEEILRGNVEMAPYVMDKRNGCEFCPYGGICGFDERLKGYESRQLEPLSKEEALEKMKEEVRSWE